MRTGQASAKTGIAPYTLCNMVSTGRIPRPAMNSSDQFDWSDADLANALRVHAERRRNRAKVVAPETEPAAS